MRSPHTYGIGEVKDLKPRDAGQVIADAGTLRARKAKCACRRAETCACAPTPLRITELHSQMVEAALPQHMDFHSPTKRMAPQ